MSARSEALYVRMFPRSLDDLSDAERRRLRRAKRAVEIAHELTADAVEHGYDSGRESGGWSRGEAADHEWLGALVWTLRALGLGCEART